MDACFFGIDVSKDSLDGTSLEAGAFKDGAFKGGSFGNVFQHANSSAGIAKVVDLVRAQIAAGRSVLVVVEATGGREVPLARALQKASIPVAVANPQRVREFARSKGILAKTDRIDARVLAQFGEAIRPEVRALADEATAELDALVTRRCQLIDMRTMESNRLDGCIDTTQAKMRRNIEKHIEWLNRHIDDADRDLGEAVKNNPLWKVRDQLQRSVPGIGPVVSQTLLSSLPELGKLPGKRLAALVGLAPHPDDSGRHKGPRHISGGREGMRAKLYMAALAVARGTSALGDFFRQLRSRGKAPKVALVAVARKLLMIVNAVVRTGTPYEDPRQVKTTVPLTA
jgi:transposase